MASSLKNRWLLCLCGIIGLLPSAAPSQTPEEIAQLPAFSTEFNSPPQGAPTIGDRVTLLIQMPANQVSQDPPYSLSVPPGSSSLKDLGWFLDKETLWSSGTLKVIVSPLKAGKLTLPTLLIHTSVDDQGKSKLRSAFARTQPLILEVNDIESKPQDPEPGGEPVPSYLPPVETKFPWSSVALILAAIVVALATLVVVIRKLKKRQAPKPQPPSVAPTPDADHIIAIRKIETLYSQNSFSERSAKPIAFGVSEILKEYFSKRFELDALESTTAELILKLRSASLSESETQEIRVLFEELDLFKFVSTTVAPPFRLDHYDRWKLKALAIIQKWARGAS